MKTHVKLILASALSVPAASVFACASCGCTLNSDWGSQGLSSTEGWSLDVRYDTLNQNELRRGTGTISSADAANVQNTALNQAAEVEKYTNNQYLTTTLDYNQGQSWGVSVAIPYINRSHSTLGTGSPDGVTPGSGAYDSQGSGLGDVRVIGRYYGFAAGNNFGLQLGLKLPTGSNTQHANDGVTQVDPGLQLGTGTTDAIVGVYYFDNLNQDWDYFTQAQYQAALDKASFFDGTSYRPGDSVNVTAGVRYHGFATFTPTLQLNVRNVQTDSGTGADTFSTGGTLVYLTPGVVLPLSPTDALHTDLQLPIYQNVNGVQLAPTSIFSVGLRFSF